MDLLVVRMRSCGHEGHGHSKLAGKEQRQVQEAARRGSRVATGIASEAIIELGLVGLLANVRGIELTDAVAQLGLAPKAADEVLGRILEIWLASREKIGSGFAAHVLDATNKEEAASNGHEESQQANVKLP